MISYTYRISRDGITFDTESGTVEANSKDAARSQVASELGLKSYQVFVEGPAEESKGRTESDKAYSVGRSMGINGGIWNESEMSRY